MRKAFLIPALASALVLLTAPATRADYSNNVMSLNPVAYWPLQETATPPSPGSGTAANSGTLGVVEDMSFSGEMVYGYPGAIAGSTDSAVWFSGFRDTRGFAPASSSVSTAPSFSVEAWIRSEDDGTYWGTTCLLSDVDANSPRSGWLLYANIDNPGQLNFRTYATNGTAPSLNYDIAAPHSIQLEKWYHIVLVVSNAVTATNFYAYYNGALVAGPVAIPAFVPNDGVAGGFTIGNRSDVTSGYTCVGAFAQVAYYTNALAPPQSSPITRPAPIPPLPPPTRPWCNRAIPPCTTT